MKSFFKIDYPILPGGRLIMCSFLGALIGASCSQDGPGIHNGPEDIEDKVIEVRIWLPSESSVPRVRAISDMDENHISSLYILSFRIDGGGSEKFDYWTECHQKEGSANGSPVQNYTAKLKVREHSQRLVLLANAGDEVKQKIMQINWSGVDKEVMLTALEEGLDGPDHKWKAGALDYKALPMWGESGPQLVIHTTSNLTETIPLLRMMAKTDVQLDASVAGLTDKFRLKSVRVYNTNTRGKLVPDKDNIEEEVFNGTRILTAKSPSIPAEVQDYSQRHFGPLVYEDFTTPGQPDRAMCNAIYLFETASTTLHAETTCLVVGGTYENDVQETYYRVDFPDETGDALGELLRNHNYTVNITDVKQRGYGDPDEAFRSKGENINVSIIKWDESMVEHIIFDDQYYYSVNPRNIEHTGVAATGAITVRTDYPEWSYRLSDLPVPGDPLANPDNVDWLRVSSHDPGFKYPGEGIAVQLFYTVAENKVVDLRTAYVHISAGRVIMTVAILQSNWNIERLVVDPTGDIPAAGQVRTVKAEGTFGSVRVRARETVSNQIFGEETIVEGANDNSAELIIPAFTPLSNKMEVRQVAFEFYDPTADTWTLIRTDFQRSIYFFITTDFNPGQTMPGIGHRYVARVEGEFPDIFLRSAIGGNELRGGTYIPAGTGTSQNPAASLINVPTNGTGLERTIDLQYSLDMNNWITISAGVQRTDHYVLTGTGRIVARVDLSKLMSWMEAMGIDYSMYRYDYYYSTYGNDKTNLHYVPQQGIETGCAGYYESADARDKGSWRLATLGELTEIKDVWDEIGGSTIYGGRYWCSNEIDMRYGLNYSLPNGTLVATYEKTEPLYVRCVMAVD